MTKEDFISQNPISTELERRGIQVSGGKCKCPFHEDQNPSFSVNDDRGWYCHGGCGKGDIFDLIAKFENKTIGEVMIECLKPNYSPKRSKLKPSTTETIEPFGSEIDLKSRSNEPEKIDKIYSYQNAHGKEIYQVVRYIPKTFRQRHLEDGKWVWDMKRVERVLYHLPEVLRAKSVWIVEGEKDADTLTTLGFTATTNVSGAAKWLPAYTESLTGKDVVICGDNDERGQEHVELVFESLAGKVESAKIVKIPETYKDVSEYAETFVNMEEAAAVLQSLCDKAQVFSKGIKIPIYFMHELESKYKKHVSNLANSSFNIGRWLPTLGKEVRSLVPGELVLIMAETGVGKTAILSNIAMHARPLHTLFFELELPETLMYERLLSWQLKMPGTEVEKTYQNADEMLGEKILKHHFDHLLICSQSKLSPENISDYIVKSELKFGERPKLVLVDYAQLVNGKGKSRYEKLSNTAEEMKIVAKDTNTIIFLTSQVGRKGKDENTEIGLFDAKDSGSLENSGGLVLGCWRDEKNATVMKIRILKNTKGKPGRTVDCNYDGALQRITERVENQQAEQEAEYYR